MAAFAVLAARLGMRPEARPIQLSIGLSFLGESLAVTLRGRSLGVPFAPQHIRLAAKAAGFRDSGATRGNSPA
jgi:hypothetical protein